MHMTGSVFRLQAPVPYLNRALAREQLGVEASAQGKTEQASGLYRDALQVPAEIHNVWRIEGCED